MAQALLYARRPLSPRRARSDASAEAGLLVSGSNDALGLLRILRSRYPGGEMCGGTSLVVSGEGQRLAMAGGGTSWQDLARYLSAGVGIDAAMQVARINPIDWHASEYGIRCGWRKIHRARLQVTSIEAIANELATRTLDSSAACFGAR